jgi:hypothetical protein
MGTATEVTRGMDRKPISVIGAALMLAMTASACEGAVAVASSRTSAPLANIEPVYYRCEVCCAWDEAGCGYGDATIAGPTGGWPYYGWAGYPYLPEGYCCQRSYRHYVERSRSRRVARWIRWIL